MTQPSAFAQAAQQASGQPTTQAADTSGNLADAYVGQPSQLFSGPVLPPSLLNKSHGMGTVRTGTILEAPYDVQARDFNSKLPKFYLATPEVNPATGKMSKVGTRPVDQATGKPNSPVLDTVIVVATEYRFDAAEAGAVGRDLTMPDDGKRAHYLSGDDLKQVKREIQRLGLRSEAEFVGLTYTVERIGQKPNQGGNPSWITKITLSR